MKRFIDYLTENFTTKDLATWEKNAKSRGYVVKELAHPSGEGTHYVAKDKHGNKKGCFDPKTKKGELE